MQQSKYNVTDPFILLKPNLINITVKLFVLRDWKLPMEKYILLSLE